MRWPARRGQWLVTYALFGFLAGTACTPRPQQAGWSGWVRQPLQHARFFQLWAQGNARLLVTFGSGAAKTPPVCLCWVSIPRRWLWANFFGNDMNSIGSYVNNKQFDMAFNFQLASSIISSADSRSASYTNRALELSMKVLDDSEFAPFLTNHDQDRVMSELRHDVNKAKVAASLLLTSPGDSVHLLRRRDRHARAQTPMRISAARCNGRMRIARALQQANRGVSPMPTTQKLTLPRKRMIQTL